MRREAVAAALLAAAAIAPSAAGAAEAPVRLSLEAGGLSVSGPSSAELPPVRLDGRAVTVQAPVGPFRVVDARGTAPGWSLVVQAARPADPLGRRMSAALAMLPAPAPPGTVALGSTAVDLDAPRALLRAEPGSGRGEHRVTPTLRLTVPADTPSARYTTTLVVTVS